MFKLIESNRKEMEEVLSGGKVVWKVTNEDEGTTSFSSKIFITTFRSFANVRNLPDDFDYFRYKGVKVVKNEVNKITSSLFRVYNKDFVNAVLDNNDYGIDIPVRFYRIIGGVILNRLPRLFANIVLPKAVA